MRAIPPPTQDGTKTHPMSSTTMAAPAAAAAAATSDAADYWARQAIEALRRDFAAPSGQEQGGPTLSSRAMAVALLAMHDAYFTVAGGDPARLPGLPAKPASVGPAQAELAMGAAASRALRALYAKQTALIPPAGSHENPPASDLDAQAHGEAVAEAWIAARAGDLALVNGPSPHPASPLPGRHRVDPFDPGQGFQGSIWGGLPRFLVPPQPLAPPPGLGDPHYAADFGEVARQGWDRYGRHATAQEREDEETGIYWAYDGAVGIGTPPRLYLQVVLQVLADFEAALGAASVTTARRLRALAMVSAAVADACADAWHHKYAYDVWRPVLGVNEPLGLMPPALGAGTPGWKPVGAPRTNQPGRLHVPPNFPAYPSGHATFGAAAFMTLRHCAERFGWASAPGDGEADAIGFSFTSDELDGRNVDPRTGVARAAAPRTYASLWEAIVENAESRIFLGVHWRFDGVSVALPGGGSGPGSPARPAELGDVGGVRLGVEVAARVRELWLDALAPGA